MPKAGMPKAGMHKAIADACQEQRARQSLQRKGFKTCAARHEIQWPLNAQPGTRYRWAFKVKTGASFTRWAFKVNSLRLGNFIRRAFSPEIIVMVSWT